MARIPDAFIDDRAARTFACDLTQRSAARWGVAVAGFETGR
jgi:hypothetical protein